MRPSVDIPAQSYYECRECGTRVTDPDGSFCSCGGELENLNRDRDV